MDLNEKTHDFPELADWIRLEEDYPLLYGIVRKIVEGIQYDILSSERTVVPGLRMALRIIAREVRDR